MHIEDMMNTEHYYSTCFWHYQRLIKIYIHIDYMHIDYYLGFVGSSHGKKINLRIRKSMKNVYDWCM